MNPILRFQLAAAVAAGLPAPGTSDARRLLPLLAKPQIDPVAPEMLAERAQVRPLVKQSRRQQRRQQQEKRRADKALRVHLPAPARDAATCETVQVRKLDLSLIHEPRRRAKLSAIARTT